MRRLRERGCAPTALMRRCSIGVISSPLSWTNWRSISMRTRGTTARGAWRCRSAGRRRLTRLLSQTPCLPGRLLWRCTRWARLTHLARMRAARLRSPLAVKMSAAPRRVVHTLARLMSLLRHDRLSRRGRSTPASSAGAAITRVASSAKCMSPAPLATATTWSRTAGSRMVCVCITAAFLRP